MDREKVVSHLQIIHTWAEFARERDMNFFTKEHLEDIAKWADDALALLKEQPQIVRCRDCKYRMKNICIIFQKYGGTKYDDWFCGDGVKKDEKRNRIARG